MLFLSPFDNLLEDAHIFQKGLKTWDKAQNMLIFS